MKAIVTLLAAILVAAGCAGGGGASGGVDRRLPAVTLPSLHDGQPAIDVGAIEGPAVVNLWATWCQPCRKELPAFQEVSAARPDVRFVGVDISEDPTKARDFLADLGVTFDQYLDDRGDLADALGTAVLPVTIVVDADGTVSTEHIGPMSVADLQRAIGHATT